MEKKIVPGTGGNRYVPYEERTGNESVVYFTRDLSPEGLKKVYARVSHQPSAISRQPSAISRQL